MLPSDHPTVENAIQEWCSDARSMLKNIRSAVKDRAYIASLLNCIIAVTDELRKPGPERAPVDIRPVWFPARLRLLDTTEFQPRVAIPSSAEGGYAASGRPSLKRRVDEDSTDKRFISIRGSAAKAATAAKKNKPSNKVASMPAATLSIRGAASDPSGKRVAVIRPNTTKPATSGGLSIKGREAALKGEIDEKDRVRRLLSASGASSRGAASNSPFRLRGGGNNENGNEMDTDERFEDSKMFAYGGGGSSGVTKSAGIGTAPRAPKRGADLLSRMSQPGNPSKELFPDAVAPPQASSARGAFRGASSGLAAGRSSMSMRGRARGSRGGASGNANRELLP